MIFKVSLKLHVSGDLLSVFYFYSFTPTCLVTHKGFPPAINRATRRSVKLYFEARSFFVAGRPKSIKRFLIEPGIRPILLSTSAVTSPSK